MEFSVYSDWLQVRVCGAFGFSDWLLVDGLWSVVFIATGYRWTGCGA